MADYDFTKKKFDFFRYEFILEDTYYLGDLVEKAVLEDVLDEAAYQADVDLVVTPDFPPISPAQRLKIVDTLFDEVLLDGVIWEVDSDNVGVKKLSLIVRDYLYYFKDSEDEFEFIPGMTATSRLEAYASTWGVPLGNVVDTGKTLDKARYRSEPLLAMVKNDLMETAKKDGGLYKLRARGRTIDLLPLGSNEYKFVLMPGENVERVNQRRTMLDTVTRVKVVGKKRGGTREPVYTYVEGNTGGYGTMYKIHEDERLNTFTEVQSAGKNLIVPIEEIITVNGLDESSLRAGDKVILGVTDIGGKNVIGTVERYVTSVKHDLGNKSTPGHMTAELATLEYIQRRYYHGESVYSPSAIT